jgi:hypothetical protein
VLEGFRVFIGRAEAGRKVSFQNPTIFTDFAVFSLQEKRGSAELGGSFFSTR